MRRFRLGTLMLLIAVVALVTALIVLSRRIAELEAAAAPTLRMRRMVAEKRSAETQVKRETERANALRIRE